MAGPKETVNIGKQLEENLEKIESGAIKGEVIEYFKKEAKEKKKREFKPRLIAIIIITTITFILVGSLIYIATMMSNKYEKATIEIGTSYIFIHYIYFMFNEYLNLY